MQRTSHRPSAVRRALCRGALLAALVAVGCQPDDGMPRSGELSPPKPIASPDLTDATGEKDRPAGEEKKAAAEAPTPAASPRTPSQAATADKPSADRRSTDTSASRPAGKPAATKAEPKADELPTPQPKRSHPAQVGQPGGMPAPPATLHEPQVVLSGEHQQSCLVKVGEKIPDLVLTDLDAKEERLRALVGDKLTVVVFWSMKEALGREEFRRLEQEVVAPFRAGPVRAVAVNVGDEDDEVRQAYRESKGTFACLLDKNKSAFAQVATGLLPRTYLLDADGRILWMDLVYSQATRRELANAIHYFLRKRS